MEISLPPQVPSSVSACPDSPITGLTEDGGQEDASQKTGNNFRKEQKVTRGCKPGSNVKCTVFRKINIWDKLLRKRITV